MVTDYYRLLGLREDCSVDEVKRAYRTKARLYHPDLNHSPDAHSLFILVTEAYEYLINHPGNRNKRGEVKSEYIREWEEIRRQQARARAAYYSRIKFEEFTRSKTYKTTRIFDGTAIIYALVISLMIVFFDIYSYSLKMSMATSEEEEPSLVFMILLLIVGITFFAFAYLHLLSFINSKRKKESQ
jgi:curved DNA-binding protein CbpA